MPMEPGTLNLIPSTIKQNRRDSLNARTDYSINRSVDFPFNSLVSDETKYAVAFQIVEKNK